MDADGKGSNDAEKVGVESSSAAPAEPRDQPAAEPPAKSSEAGKEESGKTGEECSASGGVTPASDTEKGSSEVPLINGESVKAGGDVPSKVNGVDDGEKDKGATVENEIVCASKVASDKDDDDVILIVEKSNEKVNGDQAADASLSAVEKMEKLAMDVEKYIVASVHDLIEPRMTKDVADKAQNNAGGSCGAVIKDDGEVIETCSIGNPYVCGKSAEEDIEAKEIPTKDTKEALESESLVPDDKVQEERLSELKSNSGSSEQEIIPDAVGQEQINAAVEPPANAEGGAGANAGDNDNKDGGLPAAAQLENQPEKKELGAADVPKAEITTSESGDKTAETASSEVKPEATSVLKVEAGESVQHEARTGDSNDQKVAVEQKLERSETSSAVTKEANAAVSSVREEIPESSISQSAVSTESETVTENNILEKSESVLTSKQVEDTVSVSKEMKIENSVEVVENVIEAMSQVTRETSSKSTVRQISESSTSVERIEIAGHALEEGKETVLSDDLKTSAGAAAGSEVDIKDLPQKTETVPENEKVEVKSERAETSKCPADSKEENLLKESAVDVPPAQDITPAEGTQSQGDKVSVEGLESTPKDETVSKETSEGQEEKTKEVISVQHGNESSEKEVVSPEKEVVDPGKDVVSPEKIKVELEKEVASSEKAVVDPEKEVVSSEKTVAGPEKKVESPEKEVVVPTVVEIPKKEIEVPENNVASSEKDIISHEKEPVPVEQDTVSSVKDLSSEQDLTKENGGVSSEKDAPAVSEVASTAKETVSAEKETIASEHTAVSSEEVDQSQKQVVSSEKKLMSSEKIVQSEETVSLSSEKTVVSSAKVSVKKESVSASSRTTSVTRSAVSRTSLASSRSRVVRRRSPTKTGRSRASRAEEGHDSGVDETTQSQNGESASPPKGGRASPRKRQPRSMDPSPMKRLSGSSSTASIERKKVPMNKIEVGKSASPNLKQVKSKIGSLNNTTYKPGGGNVKIESKKLDYSKASSRITAKNEDYKPRGGDKKIESQKLKWSAQSKVGSLENTTHKPGGGARKIESQKLNFKDSAQSKVGSRENIKHKPGGGDVQNIKIQEQRLDFKEKASSKVGSLQNVTHRPGGGEKRIFDDKEYLRQRSNESRSPCKTPSSVPGSEYSASRPESPEGTNPVSQATSGVTSPQPDVTSPQPNVTSPQPNVTSPQPNVTSPQPNVTSPPPAEA